MKHSKKLALAYAATSFSGAALHNVFIIYYVDLFMNIYQISSNWFFIGEVFFLIWNSVNDPLCGWLLDLKKENSFWKNVIISYHFEKEKDFQNFFFFEKYLQKQWKERKFIVISLGGFGWVISFLFIFFPFWGFLEDPSSFSIGLHFVLSLFLYDGMLTFVQLAHSSLLPDISLTSDERAQCNAYSSLLASAGSCTVFFSHFFWPEASNKIPSLFGFRVYAIIVGIVATFGFQYSAYYLSFLQPNKIPKENIDDEQKKKEHLNLRNFLWQLTFLPNYWLFVVFSFLQIFNCHFNSNFLSLFLSYYLGRSPALTSFVLSGASILPHIAVVALAPKIEKWQLYRIIQTLVTSKLVFSCFAFVFGISFMNTLSLRLNDSTNWNENKDFIPQPADILTDSSAVIIALFFLFNKVCNEIVCRHGNLVLADIVDEDFVVHHRKQTFSSLIYGTNNFFTKPGQSLAPMIGWLLLNSFGYKNRSFSEEEGNLQGEISPATMWKLATLVPIVCAVLQLIVWRKFSLKGEKLIKIKKMRKFVEEQVEGYV